MAPFRIPFTSRKPVNGQTETVNDENSKPDSNNNPYKPSLALGIKERRDEPNEFKLSSVNDEGQYLPPSPPDKKSFWYRSPTTPTNSSNPRSALAENEPFSISRESFDSYRRSFDISGRSPIVHADSYTSRTSLDSRNFRLPPRSSLSLDTYTRPAPAENDEGFEDVKLHDDHLNKPKKRSFLSRFGETSEEHSSPTNDGKHHFFSGRKRGQSGTGSELEPVQTQRPGSKGKTDNTVR